MTMGHWELGLKRLLLVQELRKSIQALTLKQRQPLQPGVLLPWLGT